MKTKRRLDVLRSLKYKLDKASLEKLYLSYIRPVMEYGSAVWVNLNETEKLKLEDLPTNAARIILGEKKVPVPQRCYVN